MADQAKQTILTSLPPIIELTENSTVTENGHNDESLLQSRRSEEPPVATSFPESQPAKEASGKEKTAEPNQPIVMDEKRKKQAETELTKFVESRLACSLNQPDKQPTQKEAKKKVKENESAYPRTQKENEDGSEIEDRSVSENQPAVRTDVIREADTDDTAEYPQEGLAKNLLSKFRNLATEADASKTKEHHPSGIASKPTGTLIIRAQGEADASHFIDADDDGNASGGVFESQPIVRTDVVKEGDRNDDEELPPAGLTKTLLSAFKEMGSSGENTPLKQRSRTGSGVSDRLNDLLLRTSEQKSSISENEPIVRENVVRESDMPADTEELPTQGTTKGLLSMFSKVNEDAERIKKKLHKPSGNSRKRWSSRGKKSEEPPSGLEGNRKVVSVAEREVVKETTAVVNEEELPKSGQAGDLLKKFKSMESTDKNVGYQLAWAADRKSKAGKQKQDQESNKKDSCVKSEEGESGKNETKEEDVDTKTSEVCETESQTKKLEVEGDNSISGKNEKQTQINSSRKVVSKFLVKDK